MPLGTDPVIVLKWPCIIYLSSGSNCPAPKAITTLPSLLPFCLLYHSSSLPKFSSMPSLVIPNSGIAINVLFIITLRFSALKLYGGPISSEIFLLNSYLSFILSSTQLSGFAEPTGVNA